MAVPRRLHHLLARLRTTEPHERDLAAAELADLLEAGQLTETEFRTAVPTLIRAALAEQEPVARESMFNALSSSAIAPTAARVDWEPIADRLDELPPDCLEHALVILGFSGDARYLSRVEPLLRHPDKDVRRAAAEAVRMLAASSAKPPLTTGARSLP